MVDDDRGVDAQAGGQCANGIVLERTAALTRRSGEGELAGRVVVADLDQSRAALLHDRRALRLAAGPQPRHGTSRGSGDPANGSSRSGVRCAARSRRPGASEADRKVDSDRFVQRGEAPHLLEAHALAVEDDGHGIPVERGVGEDVHLGEAAGAGSCPRP